VRRKIKIHKLAHPDTTAKKGRKMCEADKPEVRHEREQKKNEEGSLLGAGNKKNDQEKSSRRKCRGGGKD